MHACVSFVQIEIPEVLISIEHMFAASQLCSEYFVLKYNIALKIIFDFFFLQRCEIVPKALRLLINH